MTLAQPPRLSVTSGGAAWLELGHHRPDERIVDLGNTTIAHQPKLLGHLHVLADRLAIGEPRAGHLSVAVAEHPQPQNLTNLHHTELPVGHMHLHLQ